MLVWFQAGFVTVTTRAHHTLPPSAEITNHYHHRPGEIHKI